jgi:hypothetical protein
MSLQKLTGTEATDLDDLEQRPDVDPFVVYEVADLRKARQSLDKLIESAQERAERGRS